MQPIPLLSIIILNFILTCCNFSREKTESPIARVHDRFLYKSDLFDVIPPGTPSSDSAKLAEIFTDGWIKENLLLEMAELNLPVEQKELEKKVKAYKNSLIIFEYENLMVRQKLDTVISEDEIKTYYENNIHNFQLKDYIIQVSFLKLEKNAPRIKQVTKWFNSQDSKDIIKLEEYAHQFANKFFINDQKWIYLEEFAKEIPLPMLNIQKFLKQPFPVELEDDHYLYLLNIHNFQFKDDTSPLDLVKPRIRQMILNKRKREFVSQMRKDMYNRALIDGEIEKFIK